jgi:hypothetical protein
MNLDIILLDDEAGPDLGHQAVLGDYIAVCRNERAQNVECAAPNQHELSVALQLAPHQVESEGAEPCLTHGVPARFQIGFRTIKAGPKDFRGQPSYRPAYTRDWRMS